MKFSKFLRIKSEEDSSVFGKVEPIKQVKAVLCVLLEEWRAVLGNIAEDSRILIRRMLGGFFAP